MFTLSLLHLYESGVMKIEPKAGVDETIFFCLGWSN